jgi:hypothetical protein
MDGVAETTRSPAFPKSVPPRVRPLFVKGFAPAWGMAVEERDLVPGRTCGECNACCDVLTIDTPELKKLPGVLCPNCINGKGCSIYETRPPVCQNWYCAWRTTGELGEEWRPDRCGILVTVTHNDIPPDYQQVGLDFELLGGKVRQSLWPPFVEMVAAFIAANVPVFILVPGPPGHVAGKVFLNQSANLKAAVARRDLSATLDELIGAVEAAAKHKKEKVELD